MQEPSDLGVAEEDVSMLACNLNCLLFHAVHNGHESNVQLYGT